MNLGPKCKLHNTTQPGITVNLKVDHFAAMTYCSNLRIGISGEDPHVEIRNPESVLVEPEMPGHKLWLNMTHGRATPKEEMHDFGYGADSVEGHVPPRGDALYFCKEGVKVINYHATGDGWDELLVPYVEDMLHFEGHYYGDWSADNDGKVADAVLRQS